MTNPNISTTYELWLVTADGGAMLFASGDNFPEILQLAKERKVKSYYIIKEQRHILMDYNVKEKECSKHS